MKTVLYRYFNDIGELLYVGISCKVLIRINSKDKKWFNEIVNITIEWFDTWELAQQAKTTAIANEYPKYNIKPNCNKTSRSEVIKKIKKSNKIAYQKLSLAEKQRRAKLISLRKSGKSKTGKVNWDIVLDIRKLYQKGIDKKLIKQKYSFLTIHTINDIIAYRTWKRPSTSKPQKPNIDL